MSKKEWTVEPAVLADGSVVHLVTPTDGIMPTVHYFYPTPQPDGRVGYGFISRVGAEVAAEALNNHESGNPFLTLTPVTED